MEVERELTGLLERLNDKDYSTYGYTGEYEFAGEVSETGYIRFAKQAPTYYDKIQNGLYYFFIQSNNLPMLTAAQKEGKAVKQGIRFKFSIRSGMCHFTCGLLPLI